MKRISPSLAAGLIAMIVSLFTGCSPLPDISGSYTTTVNARRANGPGWHGSAEVLLTQNGSSLTGNVTLHHPTAGIFQIPITSGTVQDGKVVFFGHTALPLGTVDLMFRGIIKSGHIEGGANVELQCLFGQEHDDVTLLLAKA
jgi:hypothetical protein